MRVIERKSSHAQPNIHISTCSFPLSVTYSRAGCLEWWYVAKVFHSDLTPQDTSFTSICPGGNPQSAHSHVFASILFCPSHGFSLSGVPSF
eukprot:353783-Chlamydomonas_euryale.AAC.9